MTTTCKNCGKSLWLHRELDFSNVWQEGDTCEEFEKDMSKEKIELPVHRGKMMRNWRDAKGDYFTGDDLADALNTTAELREKLRITTEALQTVKDGMYSEVSTAQGIATAALDAIG